MKRLPLLPTLLVLLAVAVMIGLGIWQLQRAQWKEGLLKTYAAAAGMPPVTIPDQIANDAALYYRRASAPCLRPDQATTQAGRNSNGEAGLVHVVTCHLHDATHAPSAGSRQTYRAALGWSADMGDVPWPGGTLSGVLIPDSAEGLRLVADPPVAGLAANQAPSLDDIPNNHLAYAVQWFFFAATALIIYGLALRRRG